MSLNQYNARLMTLISNANAIKKGKTQQNNLLTVAPTSKEQYQNQVVSARTNSNGFQLNNQKSPPKGRISSGSHGNLLQGGVLSTVIQLAAANYQTLNSNSSTSTAKKTQNQPIHHPTAQHSRNNSNLEVAVTSASNIKRASTPGQYQVGQKYQPLGHDSQIASNVKVHSKTEFAQEMKKILAGSAANMPTKPTQSSLISNQSNTNNSVNNQQSQSLQQSSSASALLHILPGSKQQNQQSISQQQQSKKPHHGYSLSEVNDPSKHQVSQNSYGSYAEMHSSSKKNNSSKTDELQLFKKSLHDLRLPNVPAPPLFNLSGDFRSQSTQPVRETNPLWKTQQEQRQAQPQKLQQQQQQQSQQTVNSQQLQQQQQQLSLRTYTETANDNSNYNNISSQNGDFSSRKVLTESDEVQMIDKHFLFTKPTAPKLSSTSLLRELKAKKATQSAMYKQVASQKLTSHLRTDSSGMGTSFLKQSFQQSNTSSHQHPTTKKEAFAGILAATQSNGTSAQQSGSRTPLELVNLNNSQKLLVNSKRNDKYNNNLQQYAATTSLDSSSFKNYLKQRKNNTPDVSRATTDKQDNNINPLSTFAEHIPARDSNNIPSSNDLRARSSTPQNTSKQQGTANTINNHSQPDSNLSPPKQLQIQSPYGLRAPTSNPLPVFTLKNPSSNSTFSTNSLKNPSSTTHSTSTSSYQAPSPTILPSKNNQLNNFGVDNNTNNLNNFSNSANAFMNNNNNNGNNQIISMPAQKNAKNNSVNNFLSAQNLKETNGSQQNQLKGDGTSQSTSVKQGQSRQDGTVVPQINENNNNNNSKSNNMKVQKINSSEKLSENHQLQANSTQENKQSLSTQKEASQVNQFGPNMQQQAYNMQLQQNGSFPNVTQQQQVQLQSQTQQNQGASLLGQKPDNSTRKASETILKQEPNAVSASSALATASSFPLSSIIKEYQYKTKAGCNYNGPKTNQDNFFITPNLNNQPQRTLFSVCDGHGVNGHYCSAFLKKVLPKKIEEALSREITNTEDDFIENSLHLAFLQTSKELLESSIDCTFSGSTCVLLLVIGTKMWTANTGDSRAILCSSTQDYWYANPLSRDHKPDDPDEYERIISRGGRVETYLDENLNPVGPYRVWLQDENIPGLAMARSFGDVIASQVGVTCEPEVMAFEIGVEDKFIVLASDGVWEFISNEEVMSMLVPSFHENDIDGGCTKLIKESHASWRRNDDVVDDITCIVVYLHPQRQLGIVQNK